MKKIFKYELPVDDTVIVDMPKGARPLHVDVQRGVPYIWALVDPQHESVKHLFRVAGTGHQIADKQSENYLGTFFLLFGAPVKEQLVFHVFDVGEY